MPSKRDASALAASGGASMRRLPSAPRSTRRASKRRATGKDADPAAGRNGTKGRSAMGSDASGRGGSAESTICSTSLVVDSLAGASSELSGSSVGGVDAAEPAGVAQLPQPHRNPAQLAGDLFRRWRQKGKTLGLADVTVAAVALTHNLVLVTDNRKHFPMPELQLFRLPEGTETG